MNHLLIGNADKTEQILERIEPPFLLLDDGPIADAARAHFPKAKLFDPHRHSFNPLRNMNYKGARDFASLLYSISPQGENTLTVRNGRRALTRLLLAGYSRLSDLPSAKDTKDDAEKEALGTIEDLLLSPVLHNVLCGKTNFFFTGSIIAKLDRAELGDDDAVVLASLLIGQFKGHIVVPDLGSFGRGFHVNLIRQNRLTAGLNSLSEVSDTLGQALLSIKDKTVYRTTRRDAGILADYFDIELNPGELVGQRGNAFRATSREL
jgi:hypothetical protein